MVKAMAFRSFAAKLRPSLGLALLASSPVTLATPPELYVGFGPRYSDNIARRADQQQSDIENRFTLRGNYQTDPGKCIASANGELSYSVYSQNTYEPQTGINAGITGSCELAQGLSWEVDNQTREYTRTRRLSNTPDNRTRKNVLRTGPSYLWQLSLLDSVQLSSSYENTEYNDLSDPNRNNNSTLSYPDSDRFIGAIAWSHLFSPDFSAGLSASVSDAELDTGAQIRTSTLSGTFSKRWATTALSGSLGVSEINTTLGSFEQNSGGVVGDLNLTRSLNSGGTLYLRASREFTDRASNYDIRFNEFTFELEESNTLEATSIETGLDKIFSNGDSLSVSAFANRSDYLGARSVAGGRRDGTGVRVGYTRQLTPKLSAVASGEYELLTYKADQADYQTTGLDLGLTYRSSRRLEWAARVGRYERDSDIETQTYDENWVQLSVDYRLL
ncbi:MAG: hypothetical protein CMG91_07820 [Marinobacter sp.]|nr:hypothetical protein [Marinobacter sp.]